MTGIRFIEDPITKSKIQAIINLKYHQPPFDAFFNEVLGTKKSDKGITFVKDKMGKTIQAVIDLPTHKIVFEKHFAPFLQAENTPSNVINLSSTAEIIIQEARKFLGTPHIQGGASKEGIDCSGLTTMAYKAAQIELPRDSRSQAIAGKPVELKEVKAGDLLFFVTGSDPNRISHVGLVIKGGEMQDIECIHTSTKRGVVEEKIFKFEYWQKAFRHARRVLEV